MNARVDQLFDEARLLDPVERSMLALALLDSIEGDPVDEQAVEKAWIAEAHRRLDLIVAGSLATIPWEEAKARISAL